MWLNRPEVLVDFVQDQPFIRLPSDFGELIGYDVTQGLTSGLSLSTPQYLIDLRTSAITTSTWRYWGALTHRPQNAQATGAIALTDEPSNAESITIEDGIHAIVTFTFSTTAGTVTETDTLREVVLGGDRDATGNNLRDAINLAPALEWTALDHATAGQITMRHNIAGQVGNVTTAFVDVDVTTVTFTQPTGGRDGGRPMPVIDLWPTPNADLADAITIRYRAGWDELDDDSIFVTVPDWLEHIYLDIARLVARGYQHEDIASRSARFEELRSSLEFRDAKRRDGEMQTDYGPMMNGAVSGMIGERYWWNFNAVADPS